MTFDPDRLSSYLKEIAEIEVIPDLIKITFTDKSTLEITDDILDDEDKWFETDEDVKSIIGGELYRIRILNYEEIQKEDWVEEVMKILIVTSKGSLSVLAHTLCDNLCGFEFFFNERSSDGKTIASRV